MKIKDSDSFKQKEKRITNGGWPCARAARHRAICFVCMQVYVGFAVTRVKDERLAVRPCGAARPTPRAQVERLGIGL
jgi:hypothetical protein